MSENVQRNLFGEFPEIVTRKWEEKIEADLKGADYQKKLVWRSEEGFDVKPYYRSEDLKHLDHLRGIDSLRGTTDAPNGWIICQDLFLNQNMKEGNSRIRESLKSGTQSIRIHLEKVADFNYKQLDELLKGIPLEATNISYTGFLQTDLLYEWLEELAHNRGADPGVLSGVLGVDPLGKMILLGLPVASLENTAMLVQRIHMASPMMRIIDVNGTFFQDAGSTLVQELGFTMAMANEYMAFLTSNNSDPSLAAACMQFSFTTGPNYFMEIAKLRAARILWARISEGYGLEADQRKMHIHTTSARWNMTLYDPYVNMLRGTTEAMSAILGGADSISVLPFDYAYGTTNEFSDRIARNTQFILREEAYLDRVSDPGSGSYYIENLTDSIPQQGWDQFREIESRGGFRKAFETGWIQGEVLGSLQQKKEKTATGRKRMLGVNAFPNFSEMILGKYEGKTEDAQMDTPMTPLRPFRLSSLFEDVRLQTEKSSKRPRVFLFKYGHPTWMAARAMFSGNFFACAGYEIIDQPGFITLEEGIDAARGSGADVVVLCSEDESYVEMVPAVVSALQEQAEIVVAGYPGESMKTLKKTGIKHFIHMKSNLLDTLKEFNNLLLNPIQ